MNRRITIAALLMACATLVLVARAPAAEDVFKLVPDSASGFLVINRLAATDAKLQAAGRALQIPLPSPLMMLKQMSKTQEGLDESGTIALVTFPPEGNEPMPTPLVLIPVTDYAKFVKQLDAENGTEGVTKIKVMNTPSWARSIGGYAAITDGEHRAVLENLKVSEVSPAVAPWREWVTANDAAVVILGPGVKRLTAKAQERIKAAKSSFAQGPEQMKAMAGVFDTYAKIFETAEREVSAFGLALQLDKQDSLHVNSRTLLVSGGKWANLVAQTQPAKEHPLKGLPEGPFVVAGGGEVSEAMATALMDLSASGMKSMFGVYGLDDEQTNKLSSNMIEAFRSMRGMSMALGVGRSGESIYSNAVTIIRVDDSKKFMVTYEKSMRQYADLIKGAKGPVVQTAEIENTEVAGIPSLQITMGTPTATDQTEHQKRTMEALLGPGGKLTGYIVPADEHHILMGYVSKERLQPTIDAIKQGKAGLADDAEIAKTAALLPANPASVFYVSPAGVVDLVKRIGPAMLPPGGPKELKIPDFAKTPPIGLAVTTASDELLTSLVVPADVLRAGVQYAGKVQAMRSGATESP